MQIREIDYGKAVPIQGYGPGFFRIAGKVLRAPLMINSKGVKPWGGFEDCQPLVEFCKDIDVLFIGTGREIAPIPIEFRKILEESGIGVEIMNSPTACRNYNVLLSEDRRVAAALLAVEDI